MTPARVTVYATAQTSPGAFAPFILGNTCPTGVHDSADRCDDDPHCPADDPRCFGNRCSDHDACVPGGGK